jgi:hypothetical protein
VKLQVGCHPAFQVLTVRSVPQIAADAIKYTTFHWNAILKRLQQMFITSTTCPDRLDWSAALESAAVSQGYRGCYNKSAGSYLVLRGQLAPQVDVSPLAAPHFYPGWLHEPLRVAASAAPFQAYDMSSTLLSADRVRLPAIYSEIAGPCCSDRAL